MPSFLADENFHSDIVRGLRRRNPELDVVRVQDVGLSGTSDPVVLEQAAQQGRVVLTHDVTTMTRYAYDRLAGGLLMPGVLEVKRGLAVGQAIEEILIMVGISREDEWEGQVRYLPL